jgi:hypothetical protein
MGRLIKHSPESKQDPPSPQSDFLRENSLPKLEYTLTPSTCLSPSHKTEMVEEAINSSWEFHNPTEIKLFESNRIKIRKASLAFESNETTENKNFIPIRKQSQQLTLPDVKEEEIRNGEVETLKRFRSKKSITIPASTGKPLQKIMCKKAVLSPPHGSKLSPSPPKPDRERLQPQRSLPKLTRTPISYKESYPSNIQNYKQWPKLNTNI